MTLIQETWQKLRNGGLDLGEPVSLETPTLDGRGSFKHFLRGSIYWTPETGAHEVHGAILNHWRSFGSEQGHLGYPMIDEKAIPDGNGRVSHFEGGSIYWTPETGAHEVHAGVRNKWRELGSEKSFLGYPLTDETSTPDRSGQFNHFQGGTIYWNQQTDQLSVLELVTPLLGQPALVGLDLDPTRVLPHLKFQWTSNSRIPEFFLGMQPDIFQQLWDDRLFLRSVSKDQGIPHEVPLKIQALPLTEEQEIFTASQQIGFARLADGTVLRERTLYDLCYRGSDGAVVISAHCLYARSSWDNFGFIHATDTHVSRRIDSFRQRLVDLGLTEGARELNNYNDSFRDFVTYVNYLYDAGVVDLILATGDLVDYLFEDGDSREGPGNFGFFEKLILGSSPYSDGRAAEELRVPIFTSLGNHDYRTNAYPLMFELKIGPLGVKTISNYSNLNLTVQEVVKMGGGEWIPVSQGGSLTFLVPDVENFGRAKAAEFLKTDPAMISGSAYYFRRINRAKSFIVRAGQHRFVMLDTGPDVGAVSGIWDAIWSGILGNGSEDKLTFIGGGPNSQGLDIAEVELVKKAQSEAGASGLVVVGLHAPPLNIKGNEHAHYFRETEHPTANRHEVSGFLFRHLPGEVSLVTPIGSIDPPLSIRKDWIRTGTKHFKQGSAEDLLDDGVSRGTNADFLLTCVGKGSTRKVDLVLAGHKHRIVEFRLGFDSAKQRLLFFHDYYTETPDVYYPSTGIDNGFFNQKRKIHIEVDGQAQLDKSPVKVSEPPFARFWLLKVPPYQEPLNVAANKAAWWNVHRPLLLQTGAIGPMESNQRPDKDKRPDTSETPNRPNPSFQGFRLISVENNIMSNIRYVRRAEFDAIFEMLRGSFWTVFGRAPGTGELNAWTKEVQARKLELDQVIAGHKDFLVTPEAAQELRNVIARSYQEAFGRGAADSEMADWVREVTNRRIGYEEIVSSHISFLLTESGVQELIDMIVRSFTEVLTRFPSNEELAMWITETRRSRLTYRQIVGAHKRHKATGGQ